MNLQPTDIIIRKANGVESTWIAQRLLVELCGVTESYLWKKARPLYKKSIRECDLAKAKDYMPDSGKSWRWARIQSEYYYCLANIPDKAPTRYRSRFGDEAALIEHWQYVCRNLEETQIEQRFKQHLNKVYKNYLSFYSETLPPQQIALAKACAVLDFILDEKDDYPGTANQIYNDLSPILKKMDMQYIPHHPIRLKEKMVELEKPGNSIVGLIYLPRVGNANAELYTDFEVFSWAMQLRSMDANFSNEFIIRKVKEMCQLTGKKTPSRRWFGTSIFEQPITQYLTGEKRYGSGNSKSQMFKGYIPTANAISAGDCWEMDATRYNVIAHTAEDGKDRHLFVVAIRDVHSGDVLGYSFDYSENHAVYHQAMKMAVENAGYLPYELITDRFPGHNTPQLKDLFTRMETLGVRVDFSHNANQKAKLERWFRTLQSVFMMETKYFYGEGIKSRSSYAHRSAEYLARVRKEAKKEGWNLEKAVESASITIEKYRTTPLNWYSRKHSKIDKTPAQLHEESEKPNVIWADKQRISMLFDLKKELTLRNDGQFTTEIVGVPFDYMVPSEYFGIIANQFNQKVVVSYNLDDLSEVFLWKKHDQLLSFLCSAQLFDRPQLSGPNKEYGKMAEAKKRALEIKVHKENKLEEMIGEESLLMGPFTQKKEANQFEENYMNETAQIPLKKASGADYTPDDIANAVLNNIHNEF